jgi:hypothetical protein
MSQSSRRRWFRISCVVVGAAFILSAAGCAQSGTSSGLTAPSALASGASDSSQQSSAISQLGAPGVNYNATGSWFGVLTFTHPLDHGEGLMDIVQDGSGNLTGTGDGDPGTYTFTRTRATGGTISYQLSITSPDPDGGGPQCGRNISGLAQLNPTTNTIQARRLTGTAETETGCDAVEFSMVLTKQ